MAKLTIKRNFGVAPNNLLKNKEMSMKAKGLYTFIQSKPDDWDFSAIGIAGESSDGKSSIIAGIQELEKFGWLERIKSRLPNGQWEMQYILHDSPNHYRKSETVTITDYPPTENPPTENQQIIKTSLTKQVKQNNIETGDPEFLEVLDVLDSDFSDTNGNPIPEISKVPPGEIVEDPKKIRAEFLQSLRNSLKIAKFKDENEWTEAGRMKTLFDNLGKEVFIHRMKTILSDSFKLKNCNRLSYLRKEIESFINLEVDNTTKHKVC